MFENSQKLIHKLFYEEGKMPDKMLYIKKVMDSCTTEQQLDSTLKWGKKVLWGLYDRMYNRINKGYDTFVFIKVTSGLRSRTGILECELVNHYATRLKKFV